MIKFNAVVGNPPYQIMDGGGKGSSSIPVYNSFVYIARDLQPTYFSLIMPARWYSGGKGLDDFRDYMLSEKKLRSLVDYFDSTDVFPTVDISGGICYFLWDASHSGECAVTSCREGKRNVMNRLLLQNDANSFIRFNEAVGIVDKVQKNDFVSIETIISARKPFGDITKISSTKTSESIKVYAYPKDGYTEKANIKQNENWIKEHKVFISKAYGERGDFPYNVLAKPFEGELNSACTETYLLIGPFNNNEEVKNCISYIKTRFFRFLVLLKKNTQNAAKGVYSFAPLQDFSKPWTDEELYDKYGLDLFEREYIESLIKPMED